jgi:hypothetical protein
MNDRQRLEAIVDVVVRYLPPHGIPIKDAMSEIIELVDPLPDLLKQEMREWVGLTDKEKTFIADIAKITEPNDAPIKFKQPTRKCLQVLFDLAEAKLKEKNNG